jgi:FMNH2-dependent dimethyl sulfone monooxygenase
MSIVIDRSSFAPATQPEAASPAWPGPADFPDSPLAAALRQPLMLGLFLPIQSGGWSPSTLPRGTTWTFDYNLALTRKAEALGFDLVFGLAQWLGKGGLGGQLHYREQSLDPFIATAAMASATSRIILISTIHVLYGPWHPLHLAKFGATLDHISGGRWGVNVVTGYAAREPLMFGMTRPEHDLRYEMSDEFAGILEALWNGDADRSFDGRWWKLENAFVSPRPRFGRPILVNAASSPAGIDYAARHSDIMFITSPAGADIDATLAILPDHVARIKARARAQGRELRTIINPTIVCRPTEREAHEYRDAIIAAADHEAVAGFCAHQASGDAVSWRGHQVEQRIIGGNIQIIGSPAQVVDKLVALKDAGVDGVQLTFYDFAPDLDHFGSAVLPLMREAGLRV